MSAPHFEAAISVVKEYKRKAPLLEIVDYQLGPELLVLGSGEVAEVEEELEKYGSEDFSIIKVFYELGDVFNFASAYQLIRSVGTIDTQVWSGIEKANGYGKHSFALDRLTEPLLGMQEKNGVPEAREFMARLYSVCRYLPTPLENFYQVIEQTADKVLANRPPELYQLRNVRTGEIIVDQEELKKLYRYLEQTTKMVRRHVGGIMKKADWWPMRELMRDYEDRDQNIDILKNIIATSPEGSISIPDNIKLPDFTENRKEVHSRNRSGRQARVNVFDAHKHLS